MTDEKINVMWNKIDLQGLAISKTNERLGILEHRASTTDDTIERLFGELHDSHKEIQTKLTATNESMENIFSSHYRNIGAKEALRWIVSFVISILGLIIVYYEFFKG